MKLNTHPHTAYILTLTQAAGDMGTPRCQGGCGLLKPDPHPTALQSLFGPLQQWPSPGRGTHRPDYLLFLHRQPPSPCSRSRVASLAKEAAMSGALGRYHPGWGGCWGQPVGGSWMCSALLPVSGGSM